ncbi:membrane protein insertion efficiency factor YidD [Methanoplanus sp. FWC-SCC4]|uniref:Membrane protein insertion efficiency factor YidD n=1 Tax=Methanochimaera problematica TaxID=2609417 RepID=A0AA97FCZ6_9EURY|nr:membrane protein insertion efficiency factor YidD [Methanoplanus sp. FWC-SCC4]WOF15933.1 membrane protein insertion efficiency factor YidD [Methanoplanus sp. FWC-SCC4]
MKNIPVSLSVYLIKKLWHGNFGRTANKKHNISCRYVPSCSNYAIMALLKYGFFKGWYISVKRIMRCTSEIPKGTVDYP